jgi:Ca2+-binding RTX toxin-like protein
MPETKELSAEQSAILTRRSLAARSGVSDDGLYYLLTDDNDRFVIPADLPLNNPFGLLALNGNDSITGSDAGDFVYGNTGNDSINGFNGGDLIFGGVGDDLLNGGLGKDGLLGGDGSDSIFGGAEDDGLNGNLGDDALFGGAGHDVLRGGKGNDLLVGDDGDDLLTHRWKWSRYIYLATRTQSH